MLQVYVAQNPTEAHLVKGLLETHDIECCVKGETLYSIRGEVPITTETAPSVWIYDAQEIYRAKSIIEEYENSIRQGKTTRNNWLCKSCGEELEGQFTHCWKCGAEKD